ncbi:MAG: hypothetical protein E6H63_04330, partial [Betaproteobacteria bacterium]
MLNRKEALIAMSTMLLALPLAAAAQSETQLIDKYKTFVGSDANAKSLVDGLRDSKQVTLTDANTTTTFTPRTQKM